MADLGLKRRFDAAMLGIHDAAARLGTVRRDRSRWFATTVDPVVFTGALVSTTRRDAFQRLLDLGGQPGDSVTKETDVLVVSEHDIRGRTAATRRGRAASTVKRGKCNG